LKWTQTNKPLPQNNKHALQHGQPHKAATSDSSHSMKESAVIQQQQQRHATAHLGSVQQQKKKLSRNKHP